MTKTLDEILPVKEPDSADAIPDPVAENGAAQESRSVLVIEAPINSVEFTVRLENMLPTQVWAMAEMLRIMGNQMWAQMQGEQSLINAKMADIVNAGRRRTN